MKKAMLRVGCLGLATALLSGCGAASSQSGSLPETTGSSAETAAPDDGAVPTLKWIQPGNRMPQNYDAWQAEVNQYLEEKIGVHLDVEVVPWGDWDKRRNVLVSTAGDYDIMFTDFKTYASDVAMGAFLDLTDMLPACQELYDMIPENYWRASSVGGRIYAVPTLKDSSMTQYFIWDQSLLDKYSLDVSEAHSLAEIDPALRTIHEGEGTPSFILSQNGAIPILNVYDQMGTGLPAIGVRYDDETATVVPTLEQQDVQESLALLHQWYVDGIINVDAAIHVEDTAPKPCSFGQGWSLAAKTTWGPNMGIEATAVQWGETIVSNDTVRGSLNCISGNCAYPEKALEFLQLANTDTHLRDMLYYGLEGENFQYTQDGKVEKLNDDWSMAGYTQATFFNVSLLASDECDQWAEVKELNENAIPSVLLGFDFDAAAVKDELMNCTSIYNRYKSELLTGTLDPAVGVPEMMGEMRAAGFDQILQEAQAQVDAFVQSKAQ